MAREMERKRSWRGGKRPMGEREKETEMEKMFTIVRAE